MENLGRNHVKLGVRLRLRDVYVSKHSGVFVGFSGALNWVRCLTL